MKQMLSAVLILAAMAVSAVDFSPVNVGGIVSVAGKQDTLPYDTNAIPWSVIVQKPDIPTSSITNGLASESWVIGKNYVTESITNSLATVAHTGSYNDLSNKPTIPAPYVPSPTDTAFSNATVAVVNDMANRSVTEAVDAAIASILGSDWKTTYGGGLAGLIAALVAALTWLKTHKQNNLTAGTGISIASDTISTDAVRSFSAVGGQQPTVSGGVADVSALFSGANTSLGSTIDAKLPYAASATATLKDRAFNAVTFDGTTYDLSAALAAVVATVSGAPRDLLIVATATAATTITFTAGTIKGDKPTIDAAGTWLLTFTEYASGVWYCKQIKMEDAA